MNRSKWLALIKTLAPIIIGATVPHGDLIAPLVVTGITEAESAAGKTGKEKLSVATQIVDTGLTALNAAKPGTVDVAAIHAVIQEGISTVVDTANIVHARSLPTPGAGS